MMRYGGFWMRAAAAAIDVFIIFVAVMIITYVFGTHEVTEFSDFSPLEYTRITQDYLGGLGNVVLFILWFFYPAIMTSSKLQATVGKLCLGLIVVDNQERRLTFLRATGREFAKLVSIVFNGLGYLIVAFSQRKRGLHDILAKTYVLKKAAVNDKQEKPQDMTDISSTYD
ncbi:MAG TPA: RDD family protein [Rhodospirillaceae bacterium]|nr:RDD family protein [Rhodospirillaceae bacterium]HIJ45378.1 RDD family protein [Rhodospirillaceae bacterium]HIJ92997.1 RDD family protein [Rhodospirillaceae bacterium]